MSVGNDGLLIPGSTEGQGHMIAIDNKGQVVGKYQDHKCRPSSLAIAEIGKVSDNETLI